MIGHTVEARQHPSVVEVVYGGRVLRTMPRLRGAAGHRIDYRHIIGSLVRKPGAFARYRFREEWFPSLTFRAAYDALGRTHGERAEVTTLLTRFGLTTAAEELVPRLTQAGHPAALPVLLEVFEAEADARRQRRTARLRGAARLPPGKTFATLDTGRLPGPVVQQLEKRWPPGRSSKRRRTCWRSVCRAWARATRCAPSGTRWSRPATACCARPPMRCSGTARRET